MLRSCWRKIYGFKCWAREWLPLILSVVWECARHRKRAVIVCRCGAMGDLICALPLCEAVRKRHPGKLIVFVTAAAYRNLVLLSQSADVVYGSEIWTWPYALPTNFNVFGLVAAVYSPQTTDERDKSSGATCHLVDDLAASCGLAVTNRQPRLHPSPGLVERSRIKYGLEETTVGNRRIIAINGGPTWPVRMWEAARWQSLIDEIHSHFDAVIIQLGATWGNGSDEFDQLRGVHSLFNRLKPEEIVALIAICDLVIAIDSGPVHLAGTVGTPVIGLFGPVNPHFRLPQGSRSLGLFSDVPCLFCHNQTPVGHWISGCPHDIQCMKLLEVPIVFASVQSMLTDVDAQNGALCSRS